MRDIEERLSVLDMASPPDLWRHIEDLSVRGPDHGALRPVRSPSRRPALITLAAAAVISVGAVALTAGSSDGTYSARISSSAMEPTLEQGRCATIDTGVYAEASPSRGDVIAFRDAETGILMIKRVIGFPGEHVEQVDGVVSVDGTRLDEPYAILDRRGTLDGAWTVEENHLFVMGDNRPISNDSRFALGQVALGTVEGQVLIGAGTAECNAAAPPAPIQEG